MLIRFTSRFLHLFVGSLYLSLFIFPYILEPSAAALQLRSKAMAGIAAGIIILTGLVNSHILKYPTLFYIYERDIMN
jgi:hypothetical protein